MMKKCSKITAAVLSVILTFSFFCVTAFAANEEKAKTDIEIKNDSFFIKIPAGYKMMQSPFYDFLKSESPRIGDRIAVLVFKNKDGADVNELPKAKYSDFANSVLNDAAQQLMIIENSAEAKYVRIDESGALCCRLRLTAFSQYAYCYIFTAKNNIYCLYFSADIASCSAEVLSVLHSFCINDERFSGDENAPTGDFSDALPYEEALLKDYMRYGLYNREGLSPEGDKTFDYCEAFDYIPVFFGFTRSVSLIVLILTIIFAVEYLTKKKKIKRYENLYGKIF